jgi:Undecaprenyl-phosphate glucose phosphotransferase
MTSTTIKPSLTRAASFAGLSTTSRRHALALLDALRLAIDTLAALVSGWLAFILYYDPTEFIPLSSVFIFFQAPDDQYAKLSVLSGLVFALITFFKYGRTPSQAIDGNLRRTFSVWFVTLLVVVAVLYLLKSGSSYSRGWMITWALMTPLFLMLARQIERRVVSALQQAGFAKQRIAIIGATSQADRLLERLRHPAASNAFDVVGIFDDDHTEATTERLSNIQSIGTIADLRQICCREHIDAIILAHPGSETARIQMMVERLMDLPTNVLLGPDLAHFDLSSRPSAQLGVLPAATLTRLPTRDWGGLAKWLEDRILVIAAAIFLAPLLLLTAILIKIDSPGPVLFKQRRFGFNNVAFDVYKFRTMFVSQADAAGATQTSRDDQRVTRIGRFLRRTSIDELPQLINVWLGQMSIVGPRAHPVGMMVADQPYHEIVGHYAARHRVKPGITGLAQVNGNRGEVDTPEKAKHRVHYDLSYIENWSISLDLSIILQTIVRLPFDKKAY